MERCTGSSCTPASIATVAADVVTYADNTATPSTTYTYRVTATNGAGSTSSNTLTATTPGTTTIAAPSGLTVSMQGKNLRVDWVDNANNESRFELERTTGDDNHHHRGRRGEYDQIRRLAGHVRIYLQLPGACLRRGHGLLGVVEQRVRQGSLT